MTFAGLIPEASVLKTSGLPTSPAQGPAAAVPLIFSRAAQIVPSVALAGHEVALSRTTLNMSLAARAPGLSVCQPVRSQFLAL